MMLDTKQLQAILPHAYPFLLIDKVLDYKEGESLTAVKNITANEWPFTGDGEHTDIFPETLLIEAAAQAALVLYHVSRVKDGQKRPKYVLGKVKAEIMQTTEIGDQLKFHVLAGKMLGTSGYSNIDLFKGDHKIAQVEIFYSLRNS